MFSTEKTHQHREVDKDTKSEAALKEEKYCYRYKIEELRAEHDFHIHHTPKHIAFHLLYLRY